MLTSIFGGRGGDAEQSLGGGSSLESGSALADAAAHAEDQAEAHSQAGSLTAAEARALARELEERGISALSDFQALFVGAPVFILELNVKYLIASIEEMTKELNLLKSKKREVSLPPASTTSQPTSNAPPPTLVQIAHTLEDKMGGDAMNEAELIALATGDGVSAEVKQLSLRYGQLKGVMKKKDDLVARKKSLLTKLTTLVSTKVEGLMKYDLDTKKYEELVSARGHRSEESNVMRRWLCLPVGTAVAAGAAGGGGSASAAAPAQGGGAASSAFALLEDGGAAAGGGKKRKM